MTAKGDAYVYDHQSDRLFAGKNKATTEIEPV
jgi:hypothetical protein